MRIYADMCVLVLATDLMPSCLLKMAQYSTALCCNSISRLSAYLAIRVLIRGSVEENLNKIWEGWKRNHQFQTHGERGGGEIVNLMLSFMMALIAYSRVA